VLPALAAIVVAAGLLYSWNLGYSGLSTYYAASVKAMLANPRAMFFGALDPAATTTLDKLAGFLVPQALSAKIFGFHAWALALPQVIEGMITIVASFVIGARWRGPGMGIATAALMAFTPMLAAMFGRPMEDGMLTMCVVLAFTAWQRALIQGSLLWLCVSGAWVAIGFQAKMLQAWLILPALLIAYLACAPLPRRRRIGQIAAAGAVTIVLSLSWMTAIQLVPANARPYVDGTTSNNMYSMVFGYNGVDRLLPNAIPGAVPQLNSSPGSGQSPVNLTATSQASRSSAKLVLPQFTTQVGWLYPASLAGIVFEWLVWRRSRRPVTTGSERIAERARTGTALGLLLWLFITVVVMSAAFVPHATYLAGIALPLAAFAVSGAVGARELYTRASRVWVVVPVLVLAQTAWAVLVSATGGIQLRWLAPIIAVAGVTATVALVVSRLRGSRATVGSYRFVVAGALIAALIGPISWSLCVVGPGGGGSASDAFAGPRPTVATANRHGSTIATGLHLRPPFTAPPSGGLDREQQLLVDYVTARNHPSSVAFATDTMAIAVSLILWTDEKPMPMGGFSQRAPTPTLTTLQSLIGSRRLRFVLLADYGTSQQAPANPTVTADRVWVRQHCAVVLSGHFREGKSAPQILYDCAPGSG
jgi:4-amino-4-deoxy-L-arabinose transferase-like glycosyltransferase